MKILIVEDDINKMRQLGEFLQQEFSAALRAEARSYQSGLSHAISWQPDVVILDMTMPTYDVTQTDPGGRQRPFAGRDILSELMRRGLQLRVIVLTQFESFGTGRERMTRHELAEQLRTKFSGIYVDTVYYSPSDSRWKGQIAKLLAAEAQ